VAAHIDTFRECSNTMRKFCSCMFRIEKNLYFQIKKIFFAFNWSYKYKSI